MAVEFDHTQHNLVAQLGLLESKNPDVRIVDAHQREAAAQRARMPLCCESHKWGAQAICLPIGLALTPVARMSGDTKENFVVSPILVQLIGIIAAGAGQRSSWRAKQREPEGMVVALVRAVLDVGKNRGAIGTTLIG